MFSPCTRAICWGVNLCLPFSAHLNFGFTPVWPTWNTGTHADSWFEHSMLMERSHPLLFCLSDGNLMKRAGFWSRQKWLHELGGRLMETLWIYDRRDGGGLMSLLCKIWGTCFAYVSSLMTPSYISFLEVFRVPKLICQYLDYVPHLYTLVPEK